MKKAAAASASATSGRILRTIRVSPVLLFVPVTKKTPTGAFCFHEVPARSTLRNSAGTPQGWHRAGGSHMLGLTRFVVAIAVGFAIAAPCAALAHDDTGTVLAG